VVRNREKQELIDQMSGLIAEELNVKQIAFNDNEDSLVEISAKANFRRLGRVYGKQMKEAAGQIERFSPAEIRALEAGTTREILGHTIGFDDIEIRRQKREGLEVETSGEITVALDTTISESLRREGLAREFINRIQNMRKSNELDVTDRITISSAAGDELRRALDAHREYITSETLATGLVWTDVDGGEVVDINGLEARVKIDRVS
jgi:isoleucyl-tRNA synthetase